MSESSGLGESYTQNYTDGKSDRYKQRVNYINISYKQMT